MKKSKNTLVLTDAVREIDLTIDEIKKKDPGMALKLTEIKSMINEATIVQTSDFVKECINILFNLNEQVANKKIFYEKISQIPISKICEITGSSQTTVYRCLKNQNFSFNNESLLRKYLKL